MPNGSIIRKLPEIELSTADDKHYTLKNGPLYRAGFLLLGIPHLGWRTRARIIMGEMRKAPLDAKVLDAGCGYGIYSMMLGDKGFSVDAIDIDPDRIAAFKKSLDSLPKARAHVTPMVASLTKLPFQDASYDRIVCPEVVEHIADDTAAIKELARVLTPGGKLIFTVPAWSAFNAGFYKQFAHERPGYRYPELAERFRSFGLEPEKAFFYEYRLGTKVFMFYNSLRSKALMGLAFYPCYWLHRLDYHLKRGEPNYLAIIAKKSSTGL